MGCKDCLSKIFHKKRGPPGKLKDRTPLKQRVSFGTGHIFNDLCSAAWFTYSIVYLNKVVGLSSSQTGLLFMIGQSADAILTPFIGIGCDRLVIKPFSRYGRRKSWHLFGTIVQSIIWPFIFSPCLVCTSDSPSWLPVLYYSVCIVLLHVGFPAVQLAHLSLIPEIAKGPSEMVELNADRSAMSFFCGIYIYVITWILLGQESEKAISPKLKTDFTILGLIVVGTGLLFSVIFHWGTTEPVSSSTNKDTVPLESPDVDQSQSKQDSFHIEILGMNSVKHTPKTWRQWFKDPRFYAMSVVYTCSRIAVNLTQSYSPLYLTEALHFQIEAIAYFPLVMLVSGAFSSFMVKKISRRLGTKWTFFIASSIVICASSWFYLQTVSERRSAYAAAFLMGSGNSVMLVMALSMIADLIGNDKASGGFVYSFMGLLDKAVAGLAVLFIQEYYPESPPEGMNCEEWCMNYVRLVFTLAPGVAAALAMLIVAIFFHPQVVLSCRSIVETMDQGTQTTENAVSDLQATDAVADISCTGV